MKTLQQKADDQWNYLRDKVAPVKKLVKDAYIAGALEERERAKALIDAVSIIEKAMSDKTFQEWKMQFLHLNKVLKEYNEGVG